MRSAKKTPSGIANLGITIAETPDALAARWRKDAETLRRYAPLLADIVRRHADELDASLVASAGELTGAEAERIAPLVPYQTWRERLWTCPPDTRLAVPELTEALGRSADWVYRAVNAKNANERGRDPLPCSRLDGVLVFTAGAVREWLRASSVVVNPEPSRGKQ